MVGSANDQERRFRQIRFLVGSHVPMIPPPATCNTVGVNRLDASIQEKEAMAQNR